MLTVWSPLKSSTGTKVTREYICSLASSSSFLSLVILTRTLRGTLRIPWLHKNLFKLTSRRTSEV